jgi:tetratricopeptide (TPR) repeat protein
MPLKPALRLPLNPAIAGALALLVLAVFMQAVSFQFLTWDDPPYVTNNSHVRQGLSLSGIAWAFSAFHAANWHPLTWLSHMLDASLFGLDPRGHHATSIALHAANTILLYAFLLRATGARWRSALAAALFAVHPLHVESVAWVAERKDVLSTLFWLLTLHFYVSYVKNPGLSRYLAVAASLSLGLMAKPMLVTLPFVLLLLDAWPLRRLDPQAPADSRSREVRQRLVVEKLPLLALSVVSMVITFIAQSRGEAVAKIELVPVGDRAANAVISYAAYLWKAVYPVDLSFFYPFRENWEAGALLMSIALLAAITILAWRTRATRPALLFGWLWYLGTLVPVIGLVQVGAQAMADRYTYVPLIGIFVAVAWSLPDSGSSAVRRAVTLTGTAVILGALAVAAHTYAGKWRSSQELYLHALSVEPNNYRAHGLLASEYARERKLDQAQHHALESMRLGQSSRLAGVAENVAINHVTLGNIELARGDLTRAFEHFTRAVELNPADPVPHFNQGMVLKSAGQHDRAIPAFEAALRLNPDYARAHNHLGLALLLTGQVDRAVVHYQQAAALRPDYAEARFNLGVAFEAQGRHEDAVAQYRKALEINPDNVVNHLRLANLLIALGRGREATGNVAEALRLSPGNMTALNMQKGLGVQ